MIIRDRERLVRQGDPVLRDHLLLTLEAAVEAVDPYRCVKESLLRDDDVLRVGGEVIDLGSVDRLFVVGAGKAAYGMLRATHEVLGDLVTTGVVNSLEEGKVGPITVHRTTHPHPSEEGVLGAREIMEIALGAGENDLIICLISGGGSSMLPLPQKNVSLEDKQRTAELLMLAGASIDELNIVRKHLSAIKGGRLARAASPAKVVSLIMSDVVGDHLASIASGPTAPDPSSYREAVDVLEKYGITVRVSANVLAHLREAADETPKPGDPLFEKVVNLIVANNRKALEAARRSAERLGYNTTILTSSLEGEAREVGKVLASIGNEVALYRNPIPAPAMLIAGGETTVTVTGKGRGGRNCELVMGAISKMNEKGTVLSFGTDGLDGNSGAGGGIADRSSLNDDLWDFLRDNDSATYLEREGCLVVTGPTGTNVGDVVLIGIRDSDLDFGL
jgi:glycerate 2-kinase